MGARSFDFYFWLNVILALVMIQDLTSVPASCKAIRNEEQTGESLSTKCSADAPSSEIDDEDDDDDDDSDIDIDNMDFSQMADIEIEAHMENKNNVNTILMALLTKIITPIKTVPEPKVQKLLSAIANRADEVEIRWETQTNDKVHKVSIKALLARPGNTVNQVMQWPLNVRKSLARKLLKLLRLLDLEQRGQGEERGGQANDPETMTGHDTNAVINGMAYGQLDDFVKSHLQEIMEVLEKKDIVVRDAIAGNKLGRVLQAALNALSRGVHEEALRAAAKAVLTLLNKIQELAKGETKGQELLDLILRENGGLVDAVEEAIELHIEVMINGMDHGQLVDFVKSHLQEIMEVLEEKDIVGRDTVAGNELVRVVQAVLDALPGSSLHEEALKALARAVSTLHKKIRELAEGETKGQELLDLILDQNSGLVDAVGKALEIHVKVMVNGMDHGQLVDSVRSHLQEIMEVLEKKDIVVRDAVAGNKLVNVLQAALNTLSGGVHEEALKALATAVSTLLNKIQELAEGETKGQELLDLILRENGGLVNAVEEAIETPIDVMINAMDHGQLDDFVRGHLQEIMGVLDKRDIVVRDCIAGNKLVSVLQEALKALSRGDLHEEALRAAAKAVSTLHKKIQELAEGEAEGQELLDLILDQNSGLVDAVEEAMEVHIEVMVNGMDYRQLVDFVRSHLQETIKVLEGKDIFGRDAVAENKLMNVLRAALSALSSGDLHEEALRAAAQVVSRLVEKIRELAKGETTGQELLDLINKDKSGLVDAVEEIRIEVMVNDMVHGQLDAFVKSQLQEIMEVLKEKDIDVRDAVAENKLVSVLQEALKALSRGDLHKEALRPPAKAVSMLLEKIQELAEGETKGQELLDVILDKNGGLVDAVNEAFGLYGQLLNFVRIYIREIMAVLEKKNIVGRDALAGNKLVIVLQAARKSLSGGDLHIEALKTLAKAVSKLLKRLHELSLGEANGQELLDLILKDYGCLVDAVKEAVESSNPKSAAGRTDGAVGIG